MAPDLLIYGVKGSPFVRKVEVFLAEKGAEFEIEQVMPFPAPDWYKELHPLGRIPTLRDRSIATEGPEGTIPDSSAICAYLEAKLPEPALYPKDAFELGRALWYEEWSDSELAGRIGNGMFRPVVMAKLMGKEPDLERARRAVAEELPSCFDYIERCLKGREYAVGSSFSIADIGIATQFVNFQHAGGRVDPARWPELAGYLKRIHARPSFANCIETEQKIFPPFEL